MQVRESTPRDAESFRVCLDAVARERRWITLLEAPPLEEVRWFVETQRQRGMVQFVAVQDGRVVGWCDVIRKTAEGFRHGGDLGMGLLPELRGRGLGRQLLERTLAAVRASGITRVEIEVYASNSAAIALYERTGFVHEGRRRRARLLDGVAEDVVEMAMLFDQSSG